jgi:ribosomal protein S18 acetylase RimI-like enzyme
LVKQDLHIRRATLDDAQLLSELSAVTFSDTFRGNCTDEDLQYFINQFFNEMLIFKELQNLNDFYFIASIDKQAVGYIRMKEDVSDVEIVNQHKSLELKRIYVLKEYHSQKVGASLMNFALQFSVENDYEILWLGVWEHNEKANAFYANYGFINSGITHPFPIGNTPQTDVWLYKFIERK